MRALELTSDERQELDDELLAELFVPDVVIDMSARVFNPKTYRGYDGLRAYREDLGEVWAEVSLEPQMLLEEGEHVVAISRMRGRGRGSGAPIDAEAAGMWTVVDGRITHSRFLGEMTRDEALAALREASAGTERRLTRPEPESGDTR